MRRKHSQGGRVCQAANFFARPTEQEGGFGRGGIQHRPGDDRSGGRSVGSRQIVLPGGQNGVQQGESGRGFRQVHLRCNTPVPWW